MGRPRGPAIDSVLSALDTIPDASTRVIAETAGVNYNTARRIIGQVRKEAGTAKRHMGQEAKVVRVLNSATHPPTSAEIASESGVNRNTVRGIIVRLRLQGRISKVGNNRYRLSV